jgi:DNA recombination protein RmuC
MSAVVIAALAVAAGGVLGWLAARGGAAAASARTEELRAQLAAARQDAERQALALADAQASRAAAEARLQELESARAQLSDAFRSLAAEALAQNNSGFLTLAEQKFQALKESASTDLSQRQQAIQQLLSPLVETLNTYQRETAELGTRHVQQITAVGEQLRNLAEAEAALKHETTKLANALSKPQVRGAWGEITLRRIVELAGMSSYCDFSEQMSLATENGRIQPDMVVHMPSGREVVVDSKVPLSGFLDALDATSDRGRDEALAKHAAQLRGHVNALSGKQYWEQFTSAPEYVVLFIPNDSFLAAASEKSPELVDYALQKGVIIATPATLYGLLRAVERGWQQQKIAESAQRISEKGAMLHDRLALVVEYFEKVGVGLGKAVESYNQAVGSLESRLLPAAREFKELGAAGKKEIPQLDLVSETPRKMVAGAGE